MPPKGASMKKETRSPDGLLKAQFTQPIDEEKNHEKES
jgi:hypothetical protein